MQLSPQLKYIVTSRKFLWLLLIINAIGTIYGYYWYGGQLAITRPIFYIFVAIINYLNKRKWNISRQNSR